MRLPASVLGSLRVGLGATALLAAGCDQAAPAAAPEAPPTEVPSAESSAPPSEARALLPDEPLGAEIEELVAAAAELPLADMSPVVALARVVENPTDFVPFSDDPRTAPPIQARPRVRAPTVRAVEASRPRGHWATPSTPKPTPKWSDDGCPACGRG